MYSLRAFTRSSFMIKQRVALVSRRFFSGNPETPQQPVVPDLSFLTQLTPEQLMPVRTVVNENMKLRRRVSELQSIILAQANRMEQQGGSAESTDANTNPIASTVSAKSAHHAEYEEKFAEIVRERTVTQLKTKDRRNLILILVVSLFFVQAVITWKTEQKSLKLLAENERLIANQTPAHDEALALAREIVATLPATGVTKEFHQKLAKIEEKLRLLKLKDSLQSK